MLTIIDSHTIGALRWILTWDGTSYMTSWWYNGTRFLPERWHPVWLLFYGERGLGQILLRLCMLRAVLFTKYLKVLNQNPWLLRLHMPISGWMIRQVKHAIEVLELYAHRYWHGK